LIYVFTVTVAFLPSELPQIAIVLIVTIIVFIEVKEKLIAFY